MAQLIDTTVNGNLEVVGNLNLLSEVGKDTRQKIVELGDNPISSIAEDIVETWTNLGTGIAYISEFILNEQPRQYGVLENKVMNTVVVQTFTSYTNGSVGIKHSRIGSITHGWGDWKMDYSQLTPYYHKLYKTSDTTDYSTSYNYFDPLTGGLTTAMSKGATDKFKYATNTFDTFGDRSNYNVNGIRIGAGVSVVDLSYSVRIANLSETRTTVVAALYRLRNGTSSYLSSSHITQGYGRATLSGSTITEVKEDDFIFLQSYKSTKSIDIDVIGGNATQLVIKSII